MRCGHQLLSILDRSKYDGLSHHIPQLNNHYHFEYCQLDISARHSVRWTGDPVLHIRRPAKCQSHQPTVYCECANITPDWHVDHNISLGTLNPTGHNINCHWGGL